MVVVVSTLQPMAEIWRMSLFILLFAFLVFCSALPRAGLALPSQGLSSRLAARTAFLRSTEMFERG